MRVDNSKISYFSLTNTQIQINTKEKDDISIFKNTLDENYSIDTLDYEVSGSENSDDVNKSDDKSTSNGEYDIDGQIDDFKQGSINDCWLLGSVQAFSFSKKGSKILKNTIKNNEDGTYTVALKGINYSVTVKDSDLDAARDDGHYSNGDDDVLLLEVGIKKAFDKARKGKIEVPESLLNHINDSDNTLDFGSFRDLAYLFTGEYADVYQTKYDDIGAVVDYIADDVNNGNTVLTCVFEGENNGNDAKIVNDIDGNEVLLTPYSSHLFSVKQINDDGTIVIINPYDSETEITLSKKVFEKNVMGISFIDI